MVTMAEKTKTETEPKVANPGKPACPALLAMPKLIAMHRGEYSIEDTRRHLPIEHLTTLLRELASRASLGRKTAYVVKLAERCIRLACLHDLRLDSAEYEIDGKTYEARKTLTDLQELRFSDACQAAVEICEKIKAGPFPPGAGENLRVIADRLEGCEKPDAPAGAKVTGLMTVAETPRSSPIGGGKHKPDVVPVKSAANQPALRKAKRKPIPRKDQADVMVKCRRRCCICFGLEGDEKMKKGQIAHLDGDRSNSKPDNLAFLCQDHHDEYDRPSSQCKGLTLTEVKAYRRELHRRLRGRKPGSRAR